MEAALESGVKVEEGKVDIEADDNDDEENDEENEDGDGTSPGSRAVYLQFLNFIRMLEDTESRYIHQGIQYRKRLTSPY